MKAEKLTSLRAKNASQKAPLAGSRGAICVYVPTRKILPASTSARNLQEFYLIDKTRSVTRPPFDKKKIDRLPVAARICCRTLQSSRLFDITPLSPGSNLPDFRPS
jgi:hypothetical protein